MDDMSIEMFITRFLCETSENRNDRDKCARNESVSSKIRENIFSIIVKGNKKKV